MVRKIFDFLPFRRRKGGDAARLRVVRRTAAAAASDEDVQALESVDTDTDVLDVSLGDDLVDVAEAADVMPAAHDDGAWRDAMNPAGGDTAPDTTDPVAAKCAEDLPEPVSVPDAAGAAPGDGFPGPAAISMAEELDRIFSGAAPEGVSGAREPPVVVLPPEGGRQEEIIDGFRTVKDSVDTLKQRALTAGQLRDTIERAIERSLGDLREVVGGIQERVIGLFREGAGGQKPAPAAPAPVPDPSAAIRGLGAKVDALDAAVRDALNAAVAPVCERLEVLALALEGAQAERVAFMGVLKDGTAALEAQIGQLRTQLANGDRAAKLETRFHMLEERLVAWLERLNVQAFQGGERARDAQAAHADITARLAALVEAQAANAHLRERLHGVRDMLSQGLNAIREDVWSSFLARVLVGSRIEAALGPTHSALFKLDAILKDLAG